MGTNYYLRRNFCQHCGRSDETHIGKSSAGTKFTFHFIPIQAENVKHWKKLTKKSDAEIFNEYGEQIAVHWFWQLVKSKQSEKSQSHIDGIKSIDGYDFIEGDFQ